MSRMGESTLTTDKQYTRFVEHLRRVHFSLVVASLGLLVVASAGDFRDIDVMLAEYDRLQRITGAWLADCERGPCDWWHRAVRDSLPGSTVSGPLFVTAGVREEGRCLPGLPTLIKIPGVEYCYVPALPEPGTIMRVPSSPPMPALTIRGVKEWWNDAEDSQPLWIIGGKDTDVTCGSSELILAPGGWKNHEDACFLAFARALGQAREEGLQVPIRGSRFNRADRGNRQRPEELHSPAVDLHGRGSADGRQRGKLEGFRLVVRAAGGDQAAIGPRPSPRRFREGIQAFSR